MPDESEEASNYKLRELFASFLKFAAITGIAIIAIIGIGATLIDSRIFTS